ncbi:hypothetical protein K402DRAFT_66543 [Aulographum hederae CBS 113979]|uniref:Uncharacterized protein n=1 Tax=Aulographum hederae CBS 113979 TaxID=1176131 RepID=A0A6G1H196_9PEZI|nr:hypothetical protein K402DRAFT_66543 [Aulographum hederae CBS 113979]
MSLRLPDSILLAAEDPWTLGETDQDFRVCTEPELARRDDDTNHLLPSALFLWTVTGFPLPLPATAHGHLPQTHGAGRGGGTQDAGILTDRDPLESFIHVEAESLSRKRNGNLVSTWLLTMGRIRRFTAAELESHDMSSNLVTLSGESDKDLDYSPDFRQLESQKWC